ncbi:MAG TPA: deoxyribose-phosphate aldolase [Myxococcales bacterium]|jgi:deoxyribose-phosphate aldolase
MQLAPYLDHTLLKPDATPEQVERLCDEARVHGFAGVCVNGVHVERAVRLLPGKVFAVVGFPLGAMTSRAKAWEARELVAAGASEIDMVLPVGLLKAGVLAAVERDIRGVVEANAPVKVILETCLLTRAEKIAACRIAQEAGAAFVKTSTGFGPGGATVEDVALLRETVGSRMGVKASGGIRTASDALRMIEAGASRLGTSASVAIVQGEAG